MITKEEVGWVLVAMDELRLSIERNAEALETHRKVNTDIEIEALITEREGMITGNKQAELEGYTYLPFQENNFMQLADRMRAIMAKGG